MSTLLYIKASPREEAYSSKVAASFLSAYRTTHPQDTVVTLDVFDASIPEFNGSMIKAKYAVMHGKTHSQEEKKAWAQVLAVANQFKSADKYLFSIPMWNFGIPFALKKYLDVIIQPGITFSFSPDTGYTGLVQNKPVAAIYARGGAYAQAPEMDFQKRYMDLAFGFIGLTNVQSIVIEPTLAEGPNKAEEVLKLAENLARQLAQRF